MEMIRGEYWIVDGSVDFADGDIGDFNHEALAVQSVFSQFSDEIISLAQDLDIECENFYDYDELTESISNLLSEIQKKISDEEIMQKIGANKDAYLILCGQGDARAYVMKNDGWIAVRSNNIELYGYDDKKRRSLLNGLENILDQEGIEEENDEELEFSLHDFKTNKAYYFSLNDIKNPTARPESPIMTKGDRRFFAPVNSKYQNKSVQNPWNKEAQKAKIIPPGHELWRNTSEGIIMKKFSEWLLEHMELKNEMMNSLRRKYQGLTESWEDEAEIAIYWFASHYHGGQSHDLYKILSTSPYNPGPIMTLEKEDEIVQMMYKDLEQEFSNV